MTRLLTVTADDPDTRVDGFMSIAFAAHIVDGERHVQVAVYDGQRLVAVGLATPERARDIERALNKVTTRAMYVAQA